MGTQSHITRCNQHYIPTSCHTLTNRENKLNIDGQRIKRCRALGARMSTLLALGV